MAIDDSVVTFVKDWIWGPCMALIGWGWNKVDKRFSKLEEDLAACHKDAKAYTDKEVEGVNTEVTRQRDVSAKIFDQLRDMQKENQDRHVELLTALHTGLAGKADK